VARTQDLIAAAYRRLTADVPALGKLKLIVRLELRGRGDIQVFRVQLPGPQVSKTEPDDARVEVAMPRSHFNELAEDGRPRHWREAYEHGHIKVSGDPNVVKLVGQVIDHQMARDRLKKAH
jgi:hypothetical protein